MALDEEYESQGRQGGNPSSMVSFMVMAIGMLILLQWINSRKPAAKPKEGEEKKAPVEVKAPAVPVPLEPAPESKTLALSSPSLDVTISTKGGTLTQARLLDFAEQAGGPKGSLVLLDFPRKRPGENPPGTLALLEPGDTPGEIGPDLAFRIVESGRQRVVLERKVNTRDGHAILLRKTLSIEPRRPILAVSIEAKNLSDKPVTLPLQIVGATGFRMEPPDPTYHYGVLASKTGSQLTLNTSVYTDLVKTPLAEKNAPVRWIGFESRYFAVLFVADDPTEISRGQIQWGADGPSAALELAPIDLDPGASATRRFHLFIGPKQGDVLAEAADLDLGNFLRLGWPEWISRLCLKVLVFLHGILGSWGMSIIVLSLGIRLLLFPLSFHSQKSILRMQSLQPKIQALKEKYAKDPKRLQQETMALYRKEGVNPLGGCLPMLLQFPILIALYKGLLYAIELRHAEFGFIQDLAQPDRFVPDVFSLGLDLNLIPLLMTAASFVQSRMTPKPADPQMAQQQKIMSYMPLMFLVFFYTMPAGLTIYWFLTTLASIGESALVKHILKRPPAGREG